jgi:putative molybdopterin biosynthesis protein
MHEETPYLHDIPLGEAKERLQGALQTAGLWGPLGTERAPLSEALGRVTAAPIWAKLSSPHYHAAAMDGYAVRAADTYGASDRSPITLKVGPEAKYVDTGDPMPGWADAVIPIENVEPEGATEKGRALQAFRIRAGASPWSHIRPMGEDLVATELVLPAGQTLRPVDLGAIAGSGYADVLLQRKPRVAIIPTGSELVPAGSDAQAGEILEYNSLVLAAQVREWGGEPTRLPIIPDDIDQIKTVVRESAEDHDLVLVNAGSSAGLEDYTARVVSALGELLVHGVAVRPGHPVIIGMIDRLGSSPAKVPIIGVPGYPVSAALTGEIFVEPLLSLWLGRPPHTRPTVRATMTRKVHSSMGDDEYLRVTVGRVGERIVAAPLSRGAGVITSLVRADGIVLIPAGVQGLSAGNEVSVELYRDMGEIERTILALGSHDLTLDLMAQHLARRNGRLSSANLGSLGGLMALRRREAHLAGAHLLDPESGEYNLAYIDRYLPGVSVVVVALVYREQGLIVPPGNPDHISGLGDLVRDGITYVNRQRGSGTRILLDYQIDELGLDPDAIRGYENEQYTHLAVAASVASGRSSCGLGIHAAAEALGMDFLPLTYERYDLIIPREHYESRKLAPLLELLADSAFRNDVSRLSGYSIEPMGQVIAEL